MGETHPDRPATPPPTPRRSLQVDWDTCREPERMIRALTVPPTARKLRLYVCAAGRRIWQLLTDPRTRAAIEVAEHYVDGLATLDDLQAAYDLADAASWDAEQQIAFRLEADASWYGMLRGYYLGGPAVGIWASNPLLGVWPEDWWSHCAHFLEQLESGVGFAVGHGVSPLAPDTEPGEGMKLLNLRREAAEAEMVGLAGVVRCLFPNPSKPVCFNSEWRTSVSIALAQGVYDSRDFSPLPILADALQDAGCDNADILDHCRSEVPHYRGCWVVDGVLGKPDRGVTMPACRPTTGRGDDGSRSDG